MTKLIPICITSILFSIAIEYKTVHKLDKYGEKVYIRKDKALWILLNIIMIFFVGLRKNYNDTFVYRGVYESTSTNFRDFFNSNIAIGENPGYTFVRFLCRSLDVSTTSYLLIYAMITISIYIWFIRKYSTKIWLSIYIFIVSGSFVFAMAGMKQAIAIAFDLLAVDCAINKKWKSFVVWVIVGMLFHPYSMMFLIVPFLDFTPGEKKTYILLGGFAVLGIAMQNILGAIVGATTMLGEEYSIETFTGEGVNFFRFLVCIVPIILVFVTKGVIKNSTDRKWNIIINLSMLNGEIMFMALFGTANYFGRLANYFLIFQTVSIPYLFRGFTSRSRTILSLICVVLYAIFFYYQNALTTPFDLAYVGISFKEYILSIL